MDPSMGDLRVQAQELARGRDARTVRYPPAFRDAAVMLARTQLRQGQSVERIAAELGVSGPTLSKWLRPPTPPVLRPVAVVSAPSSARPGVGSPVLITPHGVRVEGLDCDMLVAVLQALG